ncbi:MAG: fimbrillin family protein [Prevotellaceae bacterium]|nr:fimbrillin family protein [Prevotellaceae bacterium]
MKRLFILSAAVSALASCSNSEVITEVNEPQVLDKAIAFETFSSNATRAENSQKDNKEGLENHHSNFSVWGYKDVQDTYVFGTASDSEGKSSTGVTVTAEENPASSGTYIWTYSPIRFWDKGANSYEFYACAPATETTTDPQFVLNKKTGGTQADDYFTLNNVTLNNYTLNKTSYEHSMKENQVQNPEDGGTQITTGGNIDYMIADACKITTFTSPVQLHFNHILSRLNVTVKKSDDLTNYDVALTSLVVKNIQSNGNFNESAQVTDLNKGTTGRWNTQNSPLINYVANSLSSVTTSSKYVLQSLVIPQKVKYEEINRDGTTESEGSKTPLSTNNKPYIELAYTVTSGSYTESFKAYFNLADVFMPTPTSGTKSGDIAFNEGWQNTLNITIDAAVISFTADVYQWDDNKKYDLNSNTGESSQTSTSGGN